MIKGLTARNIVANLLGGGWSALLAMLFVPMYLHFLGAEAFGLVGILTALQAVFGLFDLGIGATLNREMARLSATASDGMRERDLLKTFEAFYWSLAAAVGLVIMMLAGTIAHRWVHAQHLATSEITRSVAFMGCIVAFQFPFALYQAGLLGRQRQVMLNVITVSITTVRSAGAILIIWRVAPLVELFFAWQAFVMLIQVVITGLVLRHDLPRPPQPSRVRLSLIREMWFFSASLAGNAVLGVLLSQSDKMLLARLLPLSQFGYYTLAGSIAAILWYVINPISTAFYPRFTQLLHTGDESRAVNTYHRACQVMAVVVLPVAATVAMFAHPLIWVWTRNPALADATALTASLLVCGTALNGLSILPVLLGVAAGFPYIITATNMVAAAMIVPAIFYATRNFGISGAAVVWVVLNCLYILIAVPLVHGRVMTGEMWRWYGSDFAVPVLAAAACGGLARLLMPSNLTVAATVAYVSVAATVITVTTAAVLPHIRTMAKGFMVPSAEPL